MITHSHLSLIVPQPLDPSARRRWMATALRQLPSGVAASATVDLGGETRDSRGYVRKVGGRWHYVIPTSRDLSVVEVQAIAQAWHEAHPTGDFEIDYSTAGASDPRHAEIMDGGLREIALAAVRANHARWVAQQADRGWSYGTKFDQRGRRHPLLMPWDNLSPRAQRRELERFQSLLEILDQMDLRLARKRS